jgi:hypothetical protein
MSTDILDAIPERVPGPEVLIRRKEPDDCRQYDDQD